MTAVAEWSITDGNALGRLPNQHIRLSRLEQQNILEVVEGKLTGRLLVGVLRMWPVGLRRQWRRRLTAVTGACGKWRHSRRCQQEWCCSYMAVNQSWNARHHRITRASRFITHSTCKYTSKTVTADTSRFSRAFRLGEYRRRQPRGPLFPELPATLILFRFLATLPFTSNPVALSVLYWILNIYLIYTEHPC